MTTIKLNARYGLQAWLIQYYVCTCCFSAHGQSLNSMYLVILNDRSAAIRCPLRGRCSEHPGRQSGQSAVAFRKCRCALVKTCLCLASRWPLGHLPHNPDIGLVWNNTAAGKWRVAGSPRRRSRRERRRGARGVAVQVLGRF